MRFGRCFILIFSLRNEHNVRLEALHLLATFADLWRRVLLYSASVCGIDLDYHASRLQSPLLTLSPPVPSRERIIMLNPTKCYAFTFFFCFVWQRSIGW